MRNAMSGRTCCLLLVLVVTLVPLTFSKESNAAAGSEMWIPEKLILGDIYHGLVIVNSATDKDMTFDIVTDNSEVIHLVTETITVPAGMHHGIIEFRTTGTGNAKIFAISQDVLLEKPVNVVESALTPIMLDLITPADVVNVLSDDNLKTGYVFLLNDFENPVVATQPVQITLTSNGEIALPKKSATIEPGMHYATFKFRANGTGSLTASAANLQPDDDTILVSETDDIELHIEVAPDPIPTSSSAEIYFWLERSGKPYLPPHDIQVSLSIDKSSNLSFDSALKGALVLTPDTSDSSRRTDNADARSIVTRTAAQLAADSKRDFVIKEGEYYGRATAYSTFDETGGIVITGRAESINPGFDEETIRESDSRLVTTAPSESGITTTTDIFAYPDPAYDKVEIIVSSGSDDGPVIETLDESVIVFTDNRLKIRPSSPNVIMRDQNYVIMHADVIDYALDVKILGERNEAESDEITIVTSGKYIREPRLDITPLPVIYNKVQDLFLVSSSHDKLTTIPDLDPKASLISITTRPSFLFETRFDSESVVVVRGTITESLVDDPAVHVTSNAETVTDSLEIYNPDRKKITVEHPDKVFPHEVFPIIIHTNDLNGNLMKKSALKISSVANITTVGDLVYINQTGEHDMIFYDKNAVPFKSTVKVGESVRPEAAQTPNVAAIPTTSTFTYEVVVKNGQGSGNYLEGEEVTISAPAVIDDVFVIKKKLVGWENLTYTQPTVTFEVDDNIHTGPIYQDDFTLLAGIAGSAGAIGSVFGIKKFRKKDDEDASTEDDQILEDLLK